MTNDNGVKRLLYCSPVRWEKMARKAAQEARISPSEFLGGKRDRQNATLRWALWRSLVEAGFSYASIGRASGFDHTSVRYACLRIGDPQIGCNVRGNRGNSRRLMRQSPRKKAVVRVIAAE